MFNPGELEGEVDHSFFDSDCDDDDGITRDGGKKLESTPAHKRFPATQTEKTKGSLSPRTAERKQHLKQVDSNRSKVERKENSDQPKEEKRCKASYISPVASVSDRLIDNSSDSDDDYNLHSKKSSGAFMALLTKGRETCEKDVYSQSSNETEEEAVLPAAKHSGPKRRNKQSPKKQIRNRPLRSSTKVSVDTDSECSSSSISGRSSLESPTPPKHKESSLSPGGRRARVHSVGSGDVEESDDTVTDVSPLSSPDMSPLQSLDLNHTETEEGGLKEQQQHERAPSTGLSDRRHDEDSEHDLDECE